MLRLQPRRRNVTDQHQIIGEKLVACFGETRLDRALRRIFSEVIKNDRRRPALVTVKVIMNIPRLPSWPAIHDKKLPFFREEMHGHFSTIVGTRFFKSRLISRCGDLDSQAAESLIGFTRSRSRELTNREGKIKSAFPFSIRLKHLLPECFPLTLDADDGRSPGRHRVLNHDPPLELLLRENGFGNDKIHEREIGRRHLGAKSNREKRHSRLAHRRGKLFG